MAESKRKLDPKFPGNQPFQMKGTACKSKVNSWWKKFKK